MLELSHLQMSIKLRKTEIDALFRGIIDLSGTPTEAIITCEAKHYKDRLIAEQIINQVQEVFSSTTIGVVIPLGLKALKKRGFVVTEFQKIERNAASTLSNLTVSSQAIYELKPPVKGI
jgi:hypothetical protein